MENEYSIQLRSLNEICYCERLFHLMYVQRLFDNNADTIIGKMHHDIREKTTGKGLLDGYDLFAMTLYAMDGKLSGRLDGVIREGEYYVPIEDKNSKEPSVISHTNLWGVEVETSVWINDFPQIVGQMYLLRKNGYSCNRGRVYYRGSNKMIDVLYQPQYDELIERGVEHCITMMKNAVPPDPLQDSEKCIRCSLNWVCLPDEVNLKKHICEEPRRLYPGRPDAGILYVTTNGSKIGKSGECLNVTKPGEKAVLIPGKDVEHVCVYGNVQVTTQAIHVILQNQGTVSYFTSGGWFVGITSAAVTKNIHLRIAQFDKFGDQSFCIELVKKLVLAKIANQRTLVRRNKNEDLSELLNVLKNWKKKVSEADAIDQIRGYEGIAAKYYWSGYQKLLNDREIWVMGGRNRRPPKDEINAMLSYGYSLLLRDFISAIIECGMDYLYGFFHTIVPGRPALALDLMEPYRPLIVDSVVLRMINEGMITVNQFAKTDAGVFMSPPVKNSLIYMYEKRMDEMITHPTFGYRLSYRRMIHLEVKLLGKYIMGEISDYEPLTTR